VSGWVLPESRGRGIGTALLRWGEDLARELAAGRPGERFEFAGNASATERDSASLLLDAGYRPAYTVLEMGFDPAFRLPRVPLPDGIALRPVEPDHLEPIACCVADAYRHEFAGGRYQEVFDPSEWARELAAPKYDHRLWQVAWAGDEVVGEVLSEVADDGAEVFEVSVHPRWRRRGIARALMVHALRCLRKRGYERIRLGTVAEFPTRARDLYASVGFSVLKEFPRYRKQPA
jgi:ribosomal protein S18 acetylase RimI-like enzyme